MVRCVRVPKAEGEAARSRLLEDGLLDVSYRIGSEDGCLLIPVLGDVPGMEAAEADLRPVDRPVGDYRELMGLPEDLAALLPMSFDVVGDVGMVKIPAELSAYRSDIGAAMMRANRSLRCVYEDGGVKGELRVRDLSLIAGEGPSETVHREFGARLHTDPAKVYFNPRLAGERHRVASLVRDGEVVIDMFAGVAPFGVQICRAARPSAVYSIDLNPEAERFAQWNRRDNRAEALVPITGDAAEVVPTLPTADRMIMNLPQIAERFLPLALSRLRRGGTVHMYKIAERERFPELCQEIAAASAGDGREVSVETFELKTYSPTMSVYSLDVRLLREEAPGLVRVYHPDRLQVRVHGDRAHEPHAPPLQIRGEPVRQRAARNARLADDLPAGPPPQVVGEAAELPLYLEEDPCVADRGLDLGPVAYDSRVGHHAFHVLLGERGHRARVEARERGAEGRPLVQDALPGQPGLEALQQEHLEEPPVVAHWHSPLGVVVLDVRGVPGVGPPAPAEAVGPAGAHLGPS